ncbi:MAG TPA: cytochrome c-type biogenesis protein CcmH, partial [bacterium]|nr:cytochrome c-type biogenesis protein CcmH [bacterium]
MLPVILGLVAALLAAPVAAAATLEDQVDAIARELMCPVCAGQTVAESSSTLAVQMRAEIRRRLLAGQTREQLTDAVRDYLRALPERLVRSGF